jgi:thymidylate synthase (FAD)
MEEVSMSSVRLVAITKPVVDGVASVEDFVAYAARVSNPSNQINNETSAKLLRYLMKHSHWSPFEMVSMTVEITTTRDIGRQILRHRSFSFQEFSQRYAVADLGWEFKNARLQDNQNRQNSIETDNEDLQKQWNNKQGEVVDKVREVYDWALSNGIAKEQARSVLPEGITITKMYMAGTLRSFLHYCQLRCSNGTQKEHMEVADQIWKIVSKEFPSISGLLEE